MARNPANSSKTIANCLDFARWVDGQKWGREVSLTNGLLGSSAAPGVRAELRIRETAANSSLGRLSRHCQFDGSKKFSLRTLGTAKPVYTGNLINVQFRPFRPGDEAPFRDLNEAWIRAHFTLEKKDLEILNDPVTHILNPGGHILMATVDGAPVGCCALLAMPNRIYEIGKMTVAESYRGSGIGRKLLVFAVDYAKQLGAAGLYLESSRKLPDAVHLYESVGFRHLPPERVKPSPYARSEIHMELDF